MRSRATRDDLRIATEETLAGKAVSVAKTDAVDCLIGKVRHPKTASADCEAIASPSYCRQVSRIMQKHLSMNKKNSVITLDALDF